MSFKIQSAGKKIKSDTVKVFLINQEVNQEFSSLSGYQDAEKRMKELKKDVEYYFLENQLHVIVAFVESEDESEINEKYRKAGTKVSGLISGYKLENVTVTNDTRDASRLSSFTEGLVLANYRFEKYITNNDKKITPLKNIYLSGNGSSKEEIKELQGVLEAVFITRDLVNEPVLYLTAEKLSSIITELSHQTGFRVEVLNKKKIESLKMGGLLAVNKGSKENPTFNIMEWKPAGCVNKAPLILVGKGVTYDTGGVSLKPSPFMQTMKCDMAGAATVVGLMYAIAVNKIPVHVVGLIPATDNKLDNKAIVPGDIITMHSGHTVEVLNTDAEGRLILADALHYAKRYKPQLVFDFATLTGAAARAIGEYGSVVFQKDAKDAIEKLKDSGEKTYERVVEFPLWKEYYDQITSDIADLKNIGGPEGGANTAAKFLEVFTDYPWIHVDIAGPAFLEKNSGYLVKGGTGVGVRLVYDFIKKMTVTNER